ncbi:GNAT family N-acetyltransferase [Pseudaquabacterium rugosum]|uniref:GNAT family N-acetyltransferase n=1 Tax=Pseudaquabacterium rugosum TaxID=2984194 RepID=A0ABU9B6E1_9BURK
MSKLLAALQRTLRQGLRRAVSRLPRARRHQLYRRLVRCEERLPAGLVLGIARTREELQSCFHLLHDAYVAEGYMAPDPSGMRVTAYHALPTTTTLYAKLDGTVVGTVSLIRQGALGLPCQTIYDLDRLGCQQGRVAEVSALAIDPAHRATGGRILFPLLKFMYAYCRRYFDTRHLVIAVNPKRIELYEAILLFDRAEGESIGAYAFAHGAPAVIASLDLDQAEVRYAQVYGHAPPSRNLHRYFTALEFGAIEWPARDWHTTNDPVMTPELMDHFFNRATRVFAGLEPRQAMLLRALYPQPEYEPVLPPMPVRGLRLPLRRQPRYTLRCPARLKLSSYGDTLEVPGELLNLAPHGALVAIDAVLPEGTQGWLDVELGPGRRAHVEVRAVRRRQTPAGTVYGLLVLTVDEAWRHCCLELAGLRTDESLDETPETFEPWPVGLPEDVGAAAAGTASAPSTDPIEREATPA